MKKTQNNFNKRFNHDNDNHDDDYAKNNNSSQLYKQNKTEKFFVQI